jgi:hypothetical protein
MSEMEKGFGAHGHRCSLDFWNFEKSHIFMYPKIMALNI